MKQTICVQEANEIEIVMKDRSYTATFNMRAILYMQEELQKIGIEKLPYEHFASIALYAGIKVNHPDFTTSEANAMVLSMRPFDLQMILEEYADSANGIDLQGQEEQTKNMIAQILKGAFGTQKA